MRRRATSRSSETIRAEIIDHFGFLPPFFEPALQSRSSLIAENIWQQTLSGYIDNPIPDLFKEKLAALLSRYCTVPYCMICHSATLSPLGMKASEILELLETPAWSYKDLEERLANTATGKIKTWPEPGTHEEESILHCGVAIFLHQDTIVCHTKLRELLDEEYYNHLICFIAYNRTALGWAEAHPELSYEADMRVKEHLGPLLQAEPKLAAFFDNYRNRMQRPTEGQTLSFEDRGRIEADTNGQAIRFFATTFDISQRKNFEADALAVANSIPQLAWMADGTGYISWYNRRWYEYTGTVAAEMAGWGWQSVHHPDEVDRVTAKYKMHIASGEPWEDIFPLRSAEGEYRWFLSRAEPIRDFSGKIIRWFGTNTDITEQRKNEELLARFAAIIQSSSDFIAMADADFNPTFLNRAGRVISGFEDRIITQSTFLDFFPEQEHERICSQIFPQLANDQSWEGELELQHFVTNAQIPVHYNIFPVVARQRGQIIGYAAVARDITELKQSERRLVEARDAAEQANRAKSVFLVNMSHEIRTPLGAIMGFTELLQNPKLQKKDLLNYTAVIARNSQHLLRLVDEILDLSKVEAGKMTLERIDVQLPALLGDIASLFGQRARDKNIAFELIFAGPIPEVVRTDPTRLRQIITNIVSNAIKFTQAGHVKLRVRFADGKLEFRVTDTGCGIAEQQLGKLFKVFSQADESTSRQFGGTGLGLVLSRRIAVAMGGNLVLEQSEVGVGSVFVAHIEAEVPKGSGFVSSSEVSRLDTRYERVGTDRLLGKSILVVDDVQDNRTLISSILREQGADVQVAQDGYSALEIANTNSFELVFLDIQMPGMDGYQVLRLLNERHPELPVIAITAHAMDEEFERAKSAGFAGFVTKPVDRTKLVSAAESILGTSAPAPPPPTTDTVDVMIVEDDADIRLLFGQIIEENGHTFAAAATAQATFDLLERGIRPHLLLLDLSLPDLPGAEVIRRIRAHEEWRKVKIALVSGWDGLEQRRKELGADAILRKPVDLVNFEKLLQRFVPDFPKSDA